MALSDGLLAYYPLNNSVVDVVGSHHGSEHSISYVAGKRGYCVDLTGTSSYVSVAHGTWLNVNSISVSFWMNADTWVTNLTAVLSKQQAGSPWPAFDFRKAPGSAQLECWITPSGGGNTCYAPGTISTSTWYHIVVTYDATTHTGICYKNGMAGTAITAFSGNLSTTTTDMWFGGNAGAAGRWFDGKIDDVAIWNRALSSTEVTELYNSGSGKSPISGAAAKFAAFFRPKCI